MIDTTRSFSPYDDQIESVIAPIREPVGQPAVLVPTGVDVDVPMDREVCVDTIHDGHIIPTEIGDLDDDFLATFEQDYTDERDWGAHYIALEIAKELRLAAYLRVQLARPLLDYGRFAGVHETELDPLLRYAISTPMSRLLSPTQRRALMEAGYDGINDRMEEWIEGKRVKLAVHTYRPENEIGTRRPAVSLINRSISYDRLADLRQTTHYEFYPRELVEFTADRTLAYRLAFELERNFVPTGINSPYLMPDGAVEMRVQVWRFFDFLRTRFENTVGSKHAGTEEYREIWEMLQCTNRRSAEALCLLEQLHMGAQIPPEQNLDFEKLQHIYDEIRAFVSDNHDTLVWEFRFHPKRTSALVVEVRRDYILEMGRNAEGHERPTGIDMERVRAIAGPIAHSIAAYVAEDIPNRESHFEQERVRHVRPSEAEQW